MKSNNLHYVKVESCRNILLASACLSRGRNPNGNERGVRDSIYKVDQTLARVGVTHVGIGIVDTSPRFLPTQRAKGLHCGSMNQMWNLSLWNGINFNPLPDRLVLNNLFRGQFSKGLCKNEIYLLTEKGFSLQTLLVFLML